ncbi:MAG TPA: helicase-related protein, partial [Magnetospirillaceae bacterium]|nr:helicase-related protein [Magnetospirillaceae bacterium]
ALHGDLSQVEREKVLHRFRSRRTTILTATDVAARGIDIDRLTHVVNYSLPHDPDSYTHRIGRTGRAGNSGTAVTFVTPDECRRLFFLRKSAGAILKKGAVPEVDEVLEAKRQRIRNRILTAAAELGLVADEVEDGHPTVEEAPGGPGEARAGRRGENDAVERWRSLAREISEGLDPLDILAASLAAGYAVELDPTRYNEVRTDFLDREAEVRLFVGAGRRDGADRKTVSAFVRELSGLPDRRIGGVEVYDAFSFVTVPFEAAERTLAEARRSGRGPVVKKAFPRENPRAEKSRSAPRTAAGGRPSGHRPGGSQSSRSNSRTSNQ